MSNELSVFNIQGLLQPLRGDLVVCFLEYTHFVPGTLDQLCTSACVAYSIAGSDGPWWLGFVRALLYERDIRTETHGVLQVYH